MHHFAYRDGVLHAEAVDLASARRGGRHAVLLLFDRDAGAALPGVRRRLRRRAVARLLRHEGEFQPGGDRDAGAARRRRRRGVGRRTASARSRPACRRRRSCSPASARPRPSSRSALDEGILCVNVESEPELELLSAIAASQGPHRRRLGARQSRRRRQDPRQDRDRQVREQVRHSDQPRARGLCARREAAGRARRRRRHAHRQPDHRAAAVRRRLRAAVGFRARRCAPTATPSRMSISAAAWAFPIARTTSRRPIPPPMRRWSSARRAGSTAS